MISVCMATYNGERYILDQAQSILAQLGPGDELVVSDDASSDTTVALLESLGDPRVRILRNTRDKRGMLPVNLVTTNFENALGHALGDYIFLSDQDDVWLPGKVETMMRALERVDYAESDCIVTDSELREVAPSRYGHVTLGHKWRALLVRTPYRGACAAFRRSVLERALPFPRGIQSHDRWLGFIGSLMFSYEMLPDRLVLYRRHGDTVTEAYGHSPNPLAYRVTERLRYITALARRAMRRKGSRKH